MPTVWTLPPNNVAMYHVLGPFNNCGEIGKNDYLICEEVVRCPMGPEQCWPLQKRGIGAATDKSH